jgi:hypothetical protein
VFICFLVPNPYTTRPQRLLTCGSLEVVAMVIKHVFHDYIVMIADKASNVNGEILFIFAQGKMPAESMY